MIKIKDGNSYDINLQEFYIENEDELNNVPNNSTPGTVVILNSVNGLKVFMKNEAENFNEV